MIFCSGNFVRFTINSISLKYSLFKNIENLGFADLFEMSIPYDDLMMWIGSSEQENAVLSFGSNLSSNGVLFFRYIIAFLIIIDFVPFFNEIYILI